jgi:DNA-binding transcriptional ArsR family regulator
MVEYAFQYDSVFQSLADATRRDILQRVSQHELTISELAENYKMSFAAVAKHLNVLEHAKLIKKRKEGKKQFISANPQTISYAYKYLEQYQALWTQRFDNLENVLKEQ